MAANDKSIIIIKKKRKGGGDGHHGGAWKVAYADFVTAMMAFFLLLWLLNVTTDVQRRGIADYFAPASISKSSSGAGGIFGGMTISAPSARISNSAPPGMVDQETPTIEESDTEEEYEGTGREGESGKATGREDNTGTNTGGKGEKRGMTEAEHEAQKKAEEEAKQEAKLFKEAETELRKTIEAIPSLRKLSDNLLIDQTPEGLRIQIVDQQGYSMFPSGSAVMFPQTRELLMLVGKVVAQLPNKLSVSGHTDNTPFPAGARRDNWDLSAERANASRRVLNEAGIPDTRINNVVGRADRDPLLATEPGSPRNRRISIVLLRQSATTSAPAMPAPAIPASTDTSPVARPSSATPTPAPAAAPAPAAPTAPPAPAPAPAPVPAPAPAPAAAPPPAQAAP